MDIPDFNYTQLYCDISVDNQGVLLERLDKIFAISKNSKIKKKKKKNVYISLSQEIQKWKIEEEPNSNKIIIIPLVNRNYSRGKIANYVCSYDANNNTLLLEEVISADPSIYNNCVEQDNYIIIDKEKLEFFSE